MKYLPGFLFDLIILLFPIFLFIRDEFFSDKRTKKHKLISRILYPLLIIGVIATLIQKHQDTTKTEQFREIVTDAIVNQELKKENLEEIISKKYKSIFDVTEKEAKEWTEDFISSLPQKRSEFESLLSKSEELSNKYNLKWKPLYEFVLNSFDKRILELQKNNKIIRSEQNEVPIVVADNFSGINETIRLVQFPNKNFIRVRLIPGKIEQGLLTDFPNLVFKKNIEGQYSESIFIITFREDYFGLQIGHPVKYHDILKEMRIKDDPLLNEQFRKAIIKAINFSISNVYLHKKTVRKSK